MKGRDVAAIVAVCVAALAGCHAKNQLVTTGPAHITPGEVLAHGTIVGASRIVGGPEQLDGSTPNHPLRGRIAVHDGSANGKVVATTVVPTSGRFSIDVIPGRYVLLGRSPQFNAPGGGCPALHPVSVVAGKTVRVQVVCSAK